MENKASKNWILLDFGELKLSAKLFDTRIAREFFAQIPVSIELVAWGDEYYGSIGADLGVESPVSEIPAGGLAYTNRGRYVCIFFGQTPAWPVEHIGMIDGEGWRQLRETKPQACTIYPQPVQFSTEIK